LKQPLTQGGNLRSRISFASDADACMLEEQALMVASAADSSDIRDCKFLAAVTNLASASDSSCNFSTLLCQRLMQMNRRMQVFLLHKGAPSFSGTASYAFPSPSWLCMMIKISKGDHFFSLWRYLYWLLVPGSTSSSDNSFSCKYL